MARTTAALLPSTSALLVRFGGRLRLARLRRRLSAKQVAERAGMVPMTLRSVERGGAGVTMGAYLAVMQVLGVEDDLEQLAAADPRGRELQDASLRPRAQGDSAATTGESSPPEHVAPVGATKHPRQGVSKALPAARDRPIVRGAKRKTPASDAHDRPWVGASEFASSTALARLLTPAPPRSRKRR